MKITKVLGKNFPNTLVMFFCCDVTLKDVLGERKNAASWKVQMYSMLITL